MDASPDPTPSQTPTQTPTAQEDDLATTVVKQGCSAFSAFFTLGCVWVIYKLVMWVIE